MSTMLTRSTHSLAEIGGPDPHTAMDLAELQSLAGDWNRRARQERCRAELHRIEALELDTIVTGASHEPELSDRYEALAHLAGL